MRTKIDDDKVAIIQQRNKILAIVLFITLIPALSNQIKTDTSLLTMVFIDLFVLGPAIFLTLSVIKKKWNVQAMYFAGIGGAIGFLGGMMDTGMYALSFLALLLIFMYQEWKVLTLHSIITVIGFQLYFKQYIVFENPSQLGLFYVMYTIMFIGVMMYCLSNEKIRKQSIENQLKLEKSKKEIEQMLKETSDSKEKLNQFNQKLNKNLVSTKNISKEIENSFFEITKGVETQSTSINNINFSMKDIGTVIDSVSESSKAILESSNETDVITKKYGKEMKKVAAEMERVTHSIQSTFQLINELNEKNKDISEIVHTLNALSSQTNLLALNASIEAARAGEHGKGFAVVANEVKKLSEDSKKSSEEIGNILNQIRTKTTQIKTEVTEGLEIVQKNKETLDQTESIFEDVSQKTNSIATYSEENEQIINVLKYSSHSIINDMESIAAISEEVHSSTEEILSSIENQNENINEILSSFNEIKN